MQENNFELQITEEESGQIDAAFETLKGILMPKLRVLEKSEKKELLRMGDKSVAFVDKSLEIAKQDATLLGSFIDVSALETDVVAINTLRSYEYQFNELLSAIDDSYALAGHEAYNASLMVYSLMKNAEKMGHPGAKEKVSELKKRFPRTRSKNASEE
ncbi:hypothetical protein [Saccharicrinis aurantiacus]|uniref:hypothetical protein n=1 Tax=Saccharicrinis aurantiacus TaxID=1849719 RepID=UPI002491A38B|nr:hypothetical protein [Saccharicrinis aurantiacus]